MRHKFLIAFFLLIALLAVTAGISWYLLQDEAFLKSRLSSASLKYTGRKLTLNGPLSLDPGSVTTLEASNIEFANAEWTDQPNMATIGHLKISFRVSSLFKDQPVFPFLALQDCKISLLKDEEGKANWDMLQKKDPGQGPVPERKEFPVRLNDLEIKNCELVLTSPNLDQPLDIKATGLTMQHHGDDRWEGKGSGSVNDEALSFDGWLSPFSALVFGGPLTHELSVTLGPNTLQSSGSLQDAKTGSGANITVEFKGPEIKDFLNEFELPLFSDGAFDFKVALNTEGQMTRVDLDGDLGSVDVSASGELDRLIKPGDGNIQFSVNGPNLGALAQVFGMDGLVEDPFKHEFHANFEKDSVQINKASLKTDRDQLEISGHFSTAEDFAGTELDIHFESDEAGRWTTIFGQPQQELGPLDLDGTLSSDSTGLISIKAKAIQAATTFQADGLLGHLPGAFQPELNILFSSPDPSHLAAIAGWDWIPAAPLDIKGRVGWKEKLLQLGKVTVKLAGDQADIDGTVNLADRYRGSDFDLQLDTKNAGALGRLFGEDGFPDEPVKLAARINPDGEGLAFQVSNANPGDVNLELSGRIPDLQQPLKMDGDIDISLPRLSAVSFLVPGTKLPDAPFTAKGKLASSKNSVRLNNIAISLADNHATFNGTLNLADHYAGSDLLAQLDIRNAGALGRMFGLEGLPDQPVKLAAEVKPQGKGLAFTVKDGNLGDMQIELEGHIADMAQPMSLDARFDINLPRLNSVSFLFKDSDLPDVPFSASGSLHNEKSKTRLDEVQLAIGKMTASVDGSLLPDNSFDLSIKAAGPDASSLDSLVRTSLPAESFSIVTGLSGNPVDFKFTDLEVFLGKSKVDGNLSINLGEVKTFKGKLNSPYLDFSHWYPGDPEEKKSKPATKAPMMFDDTPVLRLTTQNLDIKLDLQIDKLYLANTTLEDVRLGFQLSKQFMQFKPFTLRGEQGGRFEGEFSLDGRSATPRMQIMLDGKDIRLGLAAIPGQDLSTYPPLELELVLDGTGTTQHEMAASLDGKLRAYVGAGKYASAGLDHLYTGFITEIFNLLNPFHKTSKQSQLDCAVFGADAKAGIVRVFPVIYHTEQLTTLSEGSLDLNTEKIDLAFHSKPRKGLGLSAGTLINPFIKVGGTLEAPAIEFDPAGTITSGGLAVATLGISVLAKSMSDRFLSSTDPCGDARKEINKLDTAAN
jgi:uncharacterized protein involved in outer membrane biogenesis